jgi:exodeoxyribonuclease VII small subunit
MTTDPPTDETSPEGPPSDDGTPVAASYTEAMAELEGLLRALEGDDLDVDALATRVGRAAELIAYCRARIRTTEDRVQEIVAALEEPSGAGSAPGVDDVE